MRYSVHLLSLCLVIGAVAPKAAPNAIAHRYHTSVTRMEYNVEEHSAEITIQTFADDLEAALSKRTRSKASGNISVDGSKKTNALVFDYLRTVFRLNSGTEQIELQWVGMELKGYSVWIYVQAKLPGGLSKASLRNNLLFDLFEDQVNIVNVLQHGKKVSLVFKRGDDAQRIP